MATVTGVIALAFPSLPFARSSSLTHLGFHFLALHLTSPHPTIPSHTLPLLCLTHTHPAIHTMASHNPNTDTTTPNNTSSGGGGFLARLRGQAEAALHRIPAMDELQHSVRQQYVSSNPRQSSHTLRVQLAIKGEKGVIIDQEALARETKSFSKNLLDFVRLESPNPASIDTADIQDVGDRIAFLTYKIGEVGGLLVW